MKRTFKVCSIYDTETTTYKATDGYHAFACLYIFNDIRNIDLRTYKCGECDDVRFMRDVPDSLRYLHELIDYGREQNIVPVVAAYNLMFDMQTLQCALASEYGMQVTAQNSTHVYVLDLIDDSDNIVLRFWDTYFLEMGGLAAMGRTAGLPKAVGDWDYSLCRGPETPLTEKELYYAARDTQVIPAYLRYILESNEWAKPSDFGCIIMTKTSLVRRMAINEIGSKKVELRNGKKMPLKILFEQLCAWEAPHDFYTYALRKACFRGGLTFTAAAAASRVVHNVISIDAVSMHHAFINGRMCPVRFEKTDPHKLQLIADSIVNLSLDRVLHAYHNPFGFGLHVMLEFRNIRLRKGSAFDRWKIGTLASAKFELKGERPIDSIAANIEADENVKAAGWVDSAYNATFAFGKLYRADQAIVCLSEYELWLTSQVYEWDSMTAIAGEATAKFVKPPDYVSLQSNILFARKQHAKQINKTYHEGEKYTADIPVDIPDGIANQLRAGSISNQAFEAWYNGTVKGMFNGIYGSQAMDPWRPDFYVEDDGEIKIDPNGKVTPDTFEAKTPEHLRVFYNYGLRIVGGSRVHMGIVLMLLYRAFGDSILVCGGDTDSVKLALGNHTADEIIDALKPLHIAITEAIAKCQTRIRANYPEFASDLAGIGTFELEPATHDKVAYDSHFEAWNKARLSIVDGHSHITCAGLSRPDGKYTVETFVDDLVANGHTFDEIAPHILGYGVSVSSDLSYSLQRTMPRFTDMVCVTLVDYLGNRFTVNVPEAIALYPAARVLGDSNNGANYSNIVYLHELGTNVPLDHTTLYLDNGKPVIEIGEFDTIS